MKTKRAFLIDAMLRWIGENGFTPYIVVDSKHPDAIVPMEYVKDGVIVLNVRPAALTAFSIGDDAIRFNARFNQIPRHVVVPLEAVISVYPKESPTEGMGLSLHDHGGYFQSKPAGEEPKPVDEVKPKRPTLTVVKGDKHE